MSSRLVSKHDGVLVCEGTLTVLCCPSVCLSVCFLFVCLYLFRMCAVFTEAGWKFKCFDRAFGDLQQQCLGHSV